MRDNDPDESSKLTLSISSLQPGLAVLVIFISVVAVYLLFATRSELMPIDIPEKVWPVEVVTALRNDVQRQNQLFGERDSRYLMGFRVTNIGLILNVTAPGMRGFVYGSKR